MISPRFLSDIGMWVAVEFQGMGYGKRMLQELLSKLKAEGIKWVTYNVDENNAASIALAESLGFDLYSTEPRVYKLQL